MRAPILVKVQWFDIKTVDKKIQAIRDDLDRYLDSYPVKSAQTKYSVMGPVGKVLQEARSGKWDLDSLAGFALNIHLSNPKAKGFISADARAALYNGIAELLNLLKGVPPTAQDKVIDRIDYGVYFVRRAKGLEWLESVRQGFVTFLREKYGTTENLAAAWGERTDKYGINFAHVQYPSKKMFADAKGQKKIDLNEFAQQAELKGYELPEDDEMEEGIR